MLAGDLYRVDPSLDREMNKCFKKLKSINKMTEKDEIARAFRDLFKNFGKSTIIPPFFCDYGSNISIGDRTFINYNNSIIDVNQVIIGNDVLIGPSCGIYTAGHPIDPLVRSSGLEFGKEIIIEDRVWIGGSSVILGGVRIGEGSIIGAGSVVTKNIPKNVIAYGNPCRVIREINQEDRDYWQKLKDQYDNSL